MKPRINKWALLVCVVTAGALAGTLANRSQSGANVGGCGGGELETTQFESQFDQDSGVGGIGSELTTNSSLRENDFDGDGRADLAFFWPGSGWNTVPIFLSDGTGRWRASNTSTPTWANQSGVIAIPGDFNGDRFTDAAFYRPGSEWNTVPILYSNSAGGWTSSNTSVPTWANQPGVIAVAADFNSDRRMDLAFHQPGSTWATVPVLLSTGNAWRSSNSPAPPWANAAGVVALAGDFNGDRRADLAFYRPGSAWTSVPLLLGNGDGTWAELNVQAPAWANQPGVVAVVGDYNGDGRSDLAFRRPGGPWSTVPVLYGNPNGVWSSSNASVPAWANQSDVVAISGDYNRDGRTDLAFHRPGGTWTSVPVLFGQSNGTWTSSNSQAPAWANQPGVIALPGDYNRDSRTDIAFHRPGSTWTTVPVLFSNGNGTWGSSNLGAPSWANQSGAVAFGRQAVGGLTISTTPVDVLQHGATSTIRAAGNYTCTDSACWGDNSTGQFGNGSAISSSRPVFFTRRVTHHGGASLTGIDAGQQYGCGVRSDLWMDFYGGYHSYYRWVCWGQDYGQFNPETLPYQYNGDFVATPTDTNVPGLDDSGVAGSYSRDGVFYELGGVVSAGTRTTCGVVVTQSLSEPHPVSGAEFEVLANGVICWGANDRGAAAGYSTAYVLPPLVPDEITDLETGGDHSCVLVRQPGTLGLAGSRVVCWGGYYFDAQNSASRDPEEVGTAVTVAENATAIAVGGSHSCWVHPGGAPSFPEQGHVTCAGTGLGVGDGTHVGSRTAGVSTTEVAGVTGAVELAAGREHTCARLSSGQVVCWGANSNGQLGNGTTTPSTTAVRVTGITHATAITAGDDHTCAMRSTGQVSCWGSNSHGQLGQPSPFVPPYPSFQR